MLIHILAGLLFLYLSARLILPLRVGARVKLAAGVALLLISQQHLFHRYVFGSLASPELPAAVLLFQNWCFISLLFLFLLTLMRDIFSLAQWIRRLGKRRESGFSPGRRQALMALAAVVPAAYGVRQGEAVPQARTLEMRSPRVPRELDGLNLVQLSDLHVSPLLGETWVREVVRRVNALQPDIILLTGDMVDGTLSRRARSVSPLKDLQARYGVFGCVGNHEYYSDFNSWMRAFPSLGVTVLQNSHKVLSIQGQQLVIAGVTDIAARRYGLPLPDHAAALVGAPENAFRILLEHRPGNADDNSRRGIDLQLSGHTHGGHMLGMRTLVARFNGGYIHGWYKVNGMQMYVSSGAGLWNGFPVRLGVPSEIASLVLRSG